MILDNNLQLADGTRGTVSGSGVAASGTRDFIRAATTADTNLGPALDIGTPRDLGVENVTIQIDSVIPIPTTTAANGAKYRIDLESGNFITSDGDINSVATNQTFCVGEFTPAQVNAGINVKLSNVPHVAGVIDSGKYLRYAQLRLTQTGAVAVNVAAVPGTPGTPAVINRGGTVQAWLTIAPGSTEHVYYQSSDNPRGGSPSYIRD